MYAPNYWQWFELHKNHDVLPDEMKHYETQLDLIRFLGLDVMSRNIYCNQKDYWFGSICDEYFEGGVEKVTSKYTKNNDIYCILQKKFIIICFKIGAN